MKLRDELTEEEPFVLEPGTATVTFCEETREVMIPWHSFRHATREAEKIWLFFQGWLVELEGESLDDLWAELQLQSVRTINGQISNQGSVNPPLVVSILQLG